MVTQETHHGIYIFIPARSEVYSKQLFMIKLPPVTAPISSNNKNDTNDIAY